MSEWSLAPRNPRKNVGAVHGNGNQTIPRARRRAAPQSFPPPPPPPPPPLYESPFRGDAVGIQRRRRHPYDEISARTYRNIPLRFFRKICPPACRRVQTPLALHSDLIGRVEKAFAIDERELSKSSRGRDRIGG